MYLVWRKARNTLTYSMYEIIPYRPVDPPDNTLKYTDLIIEQAELKMLSDLFNTDTVYILKLLLFIIMIFIYVKQMHITLTDKMYK